MAVEFALVLPILAMLMMGIVTFGLAYNDHLALTNAIREASRFGATTVNDSNWDDAVVDRAQDVYMNGTRSLADGEICVELLEHTGDVSPAGADDVKQSNGTCPVAVGTAPAIPKGVLPGECIVRVWASTPAKLNIAIASWDISLGARSVSYFERKPCVAPAIP